MSWFLFFFSPGGSNKRDSSSLRRSVSLCHIQRPSLSHNRTWKAVASCWRRLTGYQLMVAPYNRGCFLYVHFSDITLRHSLLLKNNHIKMSFNQSYLAFLPHLPFLITLFHSARMHLVFLAVSLFLSYFEDELWHVRNSYQPACTLQHIRYRGKKLKEWGKGDAERRSGNTGKVAAQTEFVQLIFILLVSLWCQLIFQIMP